MAPVRLEIYLLGPFRLLYNSRPIAGFDQARLQHLLAYLVLHGAGPLSWDQVAFLFWPDTPDHQCRKNFRTLLTRLRQALPRADDYIGVSSRTVQWRSDAAFALDVAAFEAAAAEARACTGSDRAVAAQLAAVAAYTGDLLPDCYDDWALPLREQLRQTYAEILEQLVLSLEQERDYRRALGYAQRLLQHDPLDEPAYGHIMRLHLALGERAEARRAYTACEEMLRQEFAAAPGRATRGLFERLVAPDALSLPATLPRTAQPAPLPLIRRQAEWAALLAAWRAATAGKPGMVLLTGEAGIGKTRVAEELLGWVTRQGAVAVAAQCTAAGHVSLAYAPVAEWLRDPACQSRLTTLDAAARGLSETAPEGMPGTWRCESPGDSLELPARALLMRVHAGIQWRLALLSPAAQAVAQTASVIGRRFSFAVLCQSCDQGVAVYIVAFLTGLIGSWGFSGAMLPMVGQIVEPQYAATTFALLFSFIQGAITAIYLLLIKPPATCKPVTFKGDYRALSHPKWRS